MLYPPIWPLPQWMPRLFFQSGRSYLEPLADNLPNMPAIVKSWQVVRVNDGNDSNVNRDAVEAATAHLDRKFYNTAMPDDLASFPGPVVLTINPGKMTDNEFHAVHPPKNLMFVRIRTNTWNLDAVVRPAIDHYCRVGRNQEPTPIVLTFMAYYGEESVPLDHRANYQWRKRTLNSYWAITTKAWERVMASFRANKWVHSCGKIEGELGDTHCRFCGNCLREYAATMERSIAT